MNYLLDETGFNRLSMDGGSIIKGVGINSVYVFLIFKLSVDEFVVAYGEDVNFDVNGLFDTPQNSRMGNCGLSFVYHQGDEFVNVTRLEVNGNEVDISCNDDVIAALEQMQIRKKIWEAYSELTHKLVGGHKFR